MTIDELRHEAKVVQDATINLQLDDEHWQAHEHEEALK